MDEIQHYSFLRFRILLLFHFNNSDLNFDDFYFCACSFPMMSIFPTLLFLHFFNANFNYTNYRILKFQLSLALIVLYWMLIVVSLPIKESKLI